MFLEIVLIFMIISFLASCYVIWNLNTKLEALEDWITNFMNIIDKVQSELTLIDHRGSFESDDETGAIFEQIKTTVSQLNRFKGEEQ